MHPGWAASVLWDITTEDVPNAPSYIMKKVEGSVYVDGVLTSTFSTSIGKLTGFGEPLLCTGRCTSRGATSTGPRSWSSSSARCRSSMRSGQWTGPPWSLPA